MFRSAAPIGVYDSGVGGLTVYRYLRNFLAEKIIYFGDTFNLPYGDKTPEEIVRFSHEILDFFTNLKVKVVIAACNTSSAYAVDTLNKQQPVPIFGVIDPAIRRALAMTRNRRIGLIATSGTIKSGIYQERIVKQDPGINLFPVACPKLVPLIEAGHISGIRIRNALNEYLEPLLAHSIDTLILGCTHYPLLRDEIRDLAPDVYLVDPAKQTALDVHHYLKERGCLSDSKHSEPDEFWVSGDQTAFATLATGLLAQEIGLVKHWNRGLSPIETSSFRKEERE